MYAYYHLGHLDTHGTNLNMVVVGRRGVFPNLENTQNNDLGLLNICKTILTQIPIEGEKFSPLSIFAHTNAMAFNSLSHYFDKYHC